MQASLLRYRALEARHAIGWALLVSLFMGVAVVLLTGVLIPLLPAPVNAFMERAFLIRGLGAVVLVNEYMGIYLMPFFAGASALMRALVEPRENRALEMLLSKPISRRAFLEARVGPILLASALVGLVMTLTTALIVRPYTGEGASVSVAGTIGAGLVLTSLAVLLLAVLVIPLLLVRDAFQGLLIAFLLWMVPMLPTAVLMYRPDLFEGHERLRELSCLGPNLLWFDAAMPRLGLLAVGVAVVASWGALVLGARVFERTELR
ncbi:ABC transporter permease [Archangium violaceum]|uniref:ABC transporter permease n=1 Tax=Archangium violaceum TaxID=83451 RepID=UPI0019508D6C|nr:ABC transporter permease [Archangium violaceum]QRO02088.1 ABC transporter permease [Archangium violaceum]